MGSKGCGNLSHSRRSTIKSRKEEPMKVAFTSSRHPRHKTPWTLYGATFGHLSSVYISLLSLAQTSEKRAPRCRTDFSIALFGSFLNWKIDSFRWVAYMLGNVGSGFLICRDSMRNISSRQLAPCLIMGSRTMPNVMNKAGC